MRPSINPFDTFNFTTVLTTAADFLGNTARDITAMANARSELIFLSFTLVTDATVATRVPLLTLRHPTIFAQFATCNSTVPASTTAIFTFAQTVPIITDGIYKKYLLSLPTDIYLLENWVIRLTIQGGVAGDVVSDIRAYFKVWPFEQ